MALGTLATLMVVGILWATAAGGRGAAATTGAGRDGRGARPATDAVRRRGATGSPASAVAAPSPAHPLRILLIGDSLGIDLGEALGPLVDRAPAVTVDVDARGSTGLDRPDFFDWPAELAQDLTRDRPQVLVVFLGANDDQNMLVDGTVLTFGSPAWLEAYVQRVAAVVGQATAAGCRVLWVGMPPMAPAALDDAMQTVNGAFLGVVSGRRDAAYLATWPLLSGPGGAYTSVVDAAGGAATVARTPDGVHLTAAGASLVAASVVDALRTSLHVDLPAAS